MKLFISTYIPLLLYFLVPYISIAQINPHDGVAHKHHQHDLSLVPMVKWKFYGGIGAATYGGEVTGRSLTGSNSLIKSIEPRLSLTIGTGYKINDRLFIRAEVGYYKIKAVENKLTSLKRGENGRVYYFKANNFDAAILGQFNILPYKYLMHKNSVVPYIVLGLGLTTSNPRVEVTSNNWVSLTDLSEGQVKRKVLPTVPMGVGALYRVNAQWDIGLEATLRYTLGAGSLDGDSKGGINTENLSQEAKDYFRDNYSYNSKIVLKENPRFNDLYTNVQIRVNYTIIGEKYRHLFNQVDINSSSSNRHHRHSGGFNNHLRIHE